MKSTLIGVAIGVAHHSLIRIAGLKVMNDCKENDNYRHILTVLKLDRQRETWELREKIGDSVGGAV